MENSKYKLIFDSQTSRLTEIILKVEKQTLQFSQALKIYNSWPFDPTGGQASGAYIFRNNGSAFDVSNSLSLNFFVGPLVQEVCFKMCLCVMCLFQNFRFELFIWELNTPK